MGKLWRVLPQFGDWFERQKRVLPWRDEPTPYRVWISEIMLQQTQVATVVPYFEKFIARFPDVKRLARASVDDVMLHWAGLGYYSRARNIHRAAASIVERGFPKTREEWEEIPGVGPYTAGAILSIAQDKPEAILDGNVERVVSRLRRIGRGRGDAVYKARLWRLSRALVEQGALAGVRPSVLNQALMELGATVCTPKNPKCTICPLTSMCRAFAEGDAPAYPAPKKPKEWITVREKVHCYLDDRGRVLLTKREAGEWRAGLWDFQRSPILSVEGRVTHLGTIETKYVVTRHKVSRQTEVWRVKGSLRAAEADAPGAPERRWVNANEPEVAVGSPLRKTLTELLRKFD
jgi:A/G-specific adenine glycosylase